jgi:hypothetical protein
MTANILDAMSSNSKTKARPTIPSGGHDIISKVMQFFNEEKTRGNLKYPTGNAMKRATATTTKFEATISNRRKAPPYKALEDKT